MANASGRETRDSTEESQEGVNQCQLDNFDDDSYTQTQAYTNGRMLIFGGMHSEMGQNMPTFMNDVAEIFPHFLDKLT